MHRDRNSIGIRWTKYVSNLESLFVGLNIGKIREKRLFYYIMPGIWRLRNLLNT
jgi:hypothetical protein